MPVDVAIIGAGPAGCAAAVQCRRLGLSVALIDRTGQAGGLVGNAWSIENEPSTGGAIDGPEYVVRMQRALSRLSIPVVSGTVESIASHYELRGQLPPLAVPAVIIATGTGPRPAGFAGEAALAGNVLHYEVAPVLAVGATSALVVGGGEAAFDYALSLARAGTEVTIAMRGTRHRANDRLAAAVAANPLITVAPETAIAEVVAVDGGGRASGHSAGSPFELVTRVIVVAVGRTPVLPKLDDALVPTLRRDGGAGASEGAPTSPQGLWATKEKLTIAPGLYIAGDVRLGALGQSGIAVGDGLEAAQLAAAYIADLRENR